MTIPAIVQSYIWIYLPLAIAGIFAFFTIPSLLVQDAEPHAVCRAVSAMLLSALGVLMTAISALQIVYSLMLGQLMDQPLLGIMIALFVVGVGIIVHESRVAAALPEASTVLPRLLFCHAVELTSALLAIASLFSLIGSAVMSGKFVDWELPATLLILSSLTALMTSIHLSRIGNKKTAKAAKKK